MWSFMTLISSHKEEVRVFFVFFGRQNPVVPIFPHDCKLNYPIKFFQNQNFFCKEYSERGNRFHTG